MNSTCSPEIYLLLSLERCAATSDLPIDKRSPSSKRLLIVSPPSISTKIDFSSLLCDVLLLLKALVSPEGGVQIRTER